MNSDFSQSGSHSLHPYLQELVNRFGMDSGAVEVVIHDIVENRIAAIFNRRERRIGDPSHLVDRAGLENEDQVFGPYRKGTWTKYVSIKLPDENGKTVGLLCINLDGENPLARSHCPQYGD